MIIDLVSHSSPRYVWPDIEVWGLYCGRTAWFPSASAGVHPTTRWAERRVLGGDWPDDQPTVYGAVCWQREQVHEAAMFLTVNKWCQVWQTRQVCVCVCVWESVVSLSSLVPVGLSPIRGGVLEAEGTVEIKFRRKDLLKTMKRLDSVYAGLVEQLGKCYFLWSHTTYPT